MSPIQPKIAASRLSLKNADFDSGFGSNSLNHSFIPSLNTTVCKRPTIGCRNEGNQYKHLDCDGDGIKDHACINNKNERWLISSREGCPNKWGKGTRPISKCPEFFKDGKLSYYFLPETSQVGMFIWSCQRRSLSGQTLYCIMQNSHVHRYHIYKSALVLLL